MRIGMFHLGLVTFCVGNSVSAYLHNPDPTSAVMSAGAAAFLAATNGWQIARAWRALKNVGATA